MDTLNSFEIYESGFLPQFIPLNNLPSYFLPWENIIGSISELNKTKSTRAIINNLELLDHTKLGNMAEYQRAYLILTLLTNSYVWCEGPSNASKVLPRSIAVPLWHVSQKIGISPILTHAAVDLYNFKLKDPNGPIELDNMESQHTMTGTADESWFFLIMTAIESKGGVILRKIIEIQQSIILKDINHVKQDLTVIQWVLFEMGELILRMREKCKPEVFYNVIRPYLSGWENNDNLPNGLIYEGVSEQPKKYAGGSAAQSSLLSSIDTAFGIIHADPYFQKIKNSMPLKHRQFIEYVKENINISGFIDENKDEIDLKNSFNLCIREITMFRKLHWGLVHDYIISFINNGKGTGGTDLKTFLKVTLDETKQSNK